MLVCCNFSKALLQHNPSSFPLRDLLPLLCSPVAPLPLPVLQPSCTSCQDEVQIWRNFCNYRPDWSWRRWTGRLTGSPGLAAFVEGTDRHLRKQRGSCHAWATWTNHENGTIGTSELTKRCWQVLNNGGTGYPRESSGQFGSLQALATWGFWWRGRRIEGEDSGQMIPLIELPLMWVNIVNALTGIEISPKLTAKLLFDRIDPMRNVIRRGGYRWEKGR